MLSGSVSPGGVHSTDSLFCRFWSSSWMSASVCCCVFNVLAVLPSSVDGFPQAAAPAEGGPLAGMGDALFLLGPSLAAGFHKPEAQAWTSTVTLAPFIPLAGVLKPGLVGGQ